MLFSIPTIISLIGNFAPTIVKGLMSSGSWRDRALRILDGFLNKVNKPGDSNEIALTNEHIRELKKLDLEFKAELEKNKHELDMLVTENQSSLLLKDSKSKDKFRSWWRPAVSWICVIGLFIHVLGQYILGFISGLLVASGYLSPGSVNTFISFLPPMDTSLVMSLIIPLLGLGAYRSYEKTRSSPEPRDGDLY